jgi:hypothetical protein
LISMHNHFDIAPKALGERSEIALQSLRKRCARAAQRLSKLFEIAA